MKLQGNSVLVCLSDENGKDEEESYTCRTKDNECFKLGEFLGMEKYR